MVKANVIWVAGLLALSVSCGKAMNSNDLSRADTAYAADGGASFGVVDSSVGTSTKVTLRIQSSGADAEENKSGKVTTNSKSLKVEDGKIVGLIFSSEIPTSAVVKHAYLTVMTKKNVKKEQKLTIHGLLDINDGQFISGKDDPISSIPETTASVEVVAKNWKKNTAYKSEDLAEILNEQSAHMGQGVLTHIGFKLSSDKGFSLESFDDDADQAATLEVEYE